MSVRFALLGAGRIGKVHAKAIAANPDAELVVVADAFAVAADDLAKAYGCVVLDIDSIAADPNIDAVVICTPTDTHADLIEQFTVAGKAVFCEKPIDLSVERVRTCLGVVARHKGTLMVGFNRRFDPHFMAVKQAIVDGQIGAVEMVNIISRDPGPPPIDYIGRSGGIFRDMTIHDFDMARFLLGDEPILVTAHASVLVDKAIEAAGDFDSANIILETASGAQASISNSRRASYGYDQRIEVLGAQGLVSAENQRPVSIEIANGKGFTRPPLHDFFMTRYTEAYANEITSFIAAIGSGKAATPSGEDGLKALILAEAALRSVAEGRRVAVSEIAP
ncbi:inositol 2-dehydrogenase [Devosia rhodophyticola]|uniref:Inositol 2-dehydrogenase n=1 Tax=Devosia rhodophyticola TaxID=3026423 RepID=A0ABY7YTY3_9HYPH|nr:inositol 2-dehydrogenase [Devosia rhodophyticola]WDR04808.1 inositol 2-dehydrogenase [Devosia rhodophyticola]